MAGLWSHHGSPQEMTLGEVRYSTRVMSGKQSILMSLAVAVTSSSPDLAERDTPHITIAYDPRHATAADSNKLWQTGFQWPEGVAVESCSIEPSRRILSGTVEAGALHGDGIVHRMPDWLKKNKTISEQFDVS